jgi:GTP-binding protein
VTTKPLRLRFVTSATCVDDLPSTRAEVAFAGRSNVGKSSLINALANHRRLAAVSKTPGRTRLLNLFEVEPPSRGGSAPGSGRCTLVDLPGYGYANVPERVRERWAAMIEGYLLGREELCQIVVLVDGAVGPTSLDLQMLEWAAEHDLPVHVVATKWDKIPRSRLVARHRELATRCGLEPDEVLLVSSIAGHNVAQLRAQVRSWLEEGSAR